MTSPRGRYWLNEFPLHDFCQRFTHGGKYSLARRNLRFRIRKNAALPEVYFTFARVFHSERELAAYIQTVADRLMVIEVGAIYPCDGLHQLGVRGIGVYKKELVFDVDLNDYAEIRFCVCGAQKRCCSECFELYICALAIPVLRDFIRRRNWGEACVNFSGGRGIHVWVFDERCLSFGTEERVNVCKFVKHPPVDVLHAWTRDFYLPTWERYFLNPVAGLPVLTEDNVKIVESKYLMKAFNDVLQMANLQAAAPVTSVPGKTLAAKWKYLQSKCNSVAFAYRASRMLHEMFCPRLDEKVTTDVHHLIKSPGSIHVDTEYIACAMDWDAPVLQRQFVRDAE